MMVVVMLMAVPDCSGRWPRSSKAKVGRPASPCTSRPSIMTAACRAIRAQAPHLDHRARRRERRPTRRPCRWRRTPCRRPPRRSGRTSRSPAPDAACAVVAGMTGEERVAALEAMHDAGRQQRIDGPVDRDRRQPLAALRRACPAPRRRRSPGARRRSRRTPPGAAASASNPCHQTPCAPAPWPRRGTAMIVLGRRKGIAGDGFVSFSHL